MVASFASLFVAIHHGETMERWSRPARGLSDFRRLTVTADPSAPAFTKYRRSLANVSATVCYGSALDDCWVRDSEKPKPEEVKQCPASQFPYEH